MKEDREHLRGVPGEKGSCLTKGGGSETYDEEGEVTQYQKTAPTKAGQFKLLRTEYYWSTLNAENWARKTNEAKRKDTIWDRHGPLATFQPRSPQKARQEID